LTDPSKISDQIEFKLRCIKHFEKVYHRERAYAQTRNMMLDQTRRSIDDIRKLIGPSKKLAQFANSVGARYKLTEWLEHARSGR
jgi:hypothetical protein